MKIATSLTLLISTIFLFLIHSQCHGRLIVTLEEPDGSPSDNIPVQISDSTANRSRRINLVPGRTFHLHCQSGERSSQGSLDAIWYSGDAEVIVSSAGNPNRPMIYTFLDGSRQTLVLTNFTEGNVGVYRCRERGASNTEGAAVVIGASNPVAIMNSQIHVLRFGQQEDNFRPRLVAFVSGTPYPSLSDIHWRFNNNRNLPDGVVVNGNELLLPGYIRSEIEGTYTCHVTTLAGTDSADVHVSLIYQPSISLSPFGSYSVREDSSVMLTCEDSSGVPPPTFTWSYNGSSLISGNHISISDERASAPYRSLLTIDRFQPSDSGVYKCTASNDAGSSHQAAMISILPPSPPAPPTNIQVTTISACTINIEWVWPQITTNDNMAPPDYAVFEVNFIGESRWMRIGVADVTQTSLMARIPGKGLNTNFHLRTRCTSNSRGPGDFYVSTDTFTIYSEATLSRMLSLSTQVLSSSAIQMSWTLPEQDCFNLTSFTASCKFAMHDGTMEASSKGLGSHSTTAIITGLDPDTSYNCSVTSYLRENLTGEFTAQVTTYAIQLATTLPEFDVFQLLLTGISSCEEWIKEEAAAKRDAVAMAVAEGIEGLCQCGFTASNIQMGRLQCSLSSQTSVIYQAEIHNSPHANIPHLLSLLREWIGKEPQLLIDSQLIRVDGNCSVAPVSTYGEEVCGKLKSDSQQTALTVSTYIIIGVTVGLTLILVLSVAIVIAVIAVLLSRHRKTAKLNYSCSEKQDSIPSASNPAAVTNINIETGDPYYEQMDLDGEPEYESLDNYDKLPCNGDCNRLPSNGDYDRLPSRGTDCIPQQKHEDCPGYEPVIVGNS